MNDKSPNTMTSRLRTSIVVSSYNYAPYLRQAIDSALAQTAEVDVIVVDDGSTDDSPAIIRSYGQRIDAVFKPNGGQASAWNTGFERSRGEIVIFLDSDDVLDPTVVDLAQQQFAEGDLAKVHWPLRVIDGQGNSQGRIVPPGDLPVGDLREQVLRSGVAGYAWPPTSGNAWSRRFLKQVMPIPEVEFVICPDLYLSVLAPLFGKLGALTKPLGAWRVHGGNSTWRAPVDQRLDALIARLDHSFQALRDAAAVQGFEADQQHWAAEPWLNYLRRVRLTLDEVLSVIPAGDSFILIDEDQWETSDVIAGRRRIPFLEHDGRYWGPPADGEQAVREFERLRAAGADYMVVAWPGFWWLDHYRALRDCLNQTRRILENDRLIIFDLRMLAIHA